MCDHSIWGSIFWCLFSKKLEKVFTVNMLLCKNLKWSCCCCRSLQDGRARKGESSSVEDGALSPAFAAPEPPNTCSSHVHFCTHHWLPHRVAWPEWSRVPDHAQHTALWSISQKPSYHGSVALLTVVSPHLELCEASDFLNTGLIIRFCFEECDVSMADIASQ